MANLPGIALRPSEGEAPSAASVGAYDLGLPDAAQNLQPFAKAAQKADADAVRGRLEDLEGQANRELAQQGELYDGTRPGFAKDQIASFETKAQATLADTSLPIGQRLALRRGVDALRAGFGQKALAVESTRAGELVKNAQDAADTHVVDEALGRYNEAYAGSSGRMKSAGAYNAPTYVADQLAAHDEAAQAALDSVPEAQRPDLQRKLDGQRNMVQAQAISDAALGQRVAAASSAQKSGQMLANGVFSDPARVTAALASMPGFAGLGPKEAEAAKTQLGGDIVAARISGLAAKGHADQALKELNDGTWDAYLAPDKKMALDKTLREDAQANARQALEAFHWGGNPDLVQAKRNAEVAGNQGLAAEAQWRIDVGDLEPGALKELETGGASGFGRAFDFTVDGLEGGAKLVPNDNGHGPTRFGINAAAHPGVDIAGLTRPMAQQMAKKYWVAIGADSLPPDLASAAFATAYNTGIGPVKSMLAQSGNDTGKFLALAEQRYRAIAAEPGQAKNLPVWLDRLAKVRAEAARQAAFVNVAGEVAGDPLKFAMGDAKRAPLANVPALPQSTSDPAWGPALRQRLAVGQMMNQRYHAPMRLLTDGDAAFYKSALEADPREGIALAHAALPVIGPANTRALLGEIGLKGASPELHVADLAAYGLTSFTQSAAQGLALGDQIKSDPMKTRALHAAFDEVATLFANQPEVRAAIQGSAEAALRADAAGGKSRPSSWYLESALGGSMRGGKAFGGVAYVNGAPTIVPPWLAKDHLDDAIRSLAGGWEATGRGPVWGTNGRPATAREIANMQLKQQPNGRYRFESKQGVTLWTKGGGPFEVDLDAAAKALRAQFGKGAVLEGF